MITALAGGALFACNESTVTPPEPELVPQLHSGQKPEEPPTLLAWQAEARRLVGANNVGAQPATRVYALLSVGQYGAITDRNNRGEKRHEHGRDDYQSGAIAGASSVILSYLFPTAQATLQQRLEDAADAAHNDRQFDKGLDAGRRWGNIMVDWAKADRFTAVPTPADLQFPANPGKWRPNDPTMPAAAIGPLYGKAEPYFLTSGDQFRSPPPPLFNSPAFLADLLEVRRFSDTPDPAERARQVAIAVFWNMPAGTFTAGGYWNQAAANLIQQYGLSERQAAHVFALMHAAVFDATIGCWDTKYHYVYIRPWQVDGVIATPIGRPNHPSYPSGHSCVSSAATTVLSHFFPAETDDLEDQLQEAGLSRIYGGIHYRFDITAGQNLGKSVGHYAIQFDQRMGLLHNVEASIQ